MVLIVGVVAGRAATLLRYDLWYDELYSLFTALGDLSQLWQASLADRVHPPLFYAVLWGWLQFTAPTPTLLRILPLLIFAGTLAATWWATGGTALSVRGRVVAVLAVAINPIAFDAAAEVRGYTLLLAMTAIMVGAMLRLVRGAPSTRTLVILILGATAATWTHYFAWPFVAVTAVILYLGHRRREALLFTGTTLLASLPWIAALLTTKGSQVSTQVGWTPAGTLTSIALLPGMLLADRVPMYGLIIASVLGWTLLAAAARKADRRDLALLVAAAPVAAVFGGLLLDLGLWNGRYFTAGVIPLALLIAHWSDSVKAPQRVGAVLILGLSAWGTLTPATWRTPWRSVARELAARAPGAPIYAFEGFTVVPLRYYSDLDGLGLVVQERKTWPDSTTSPGWLLLRPSMFHYRGRGSDELRAAERTVTDSLFDGEGTNRIEAWRFK